MSGMRSVPAWIGIACVAFVTAACGTAAKSPAAAPPAHRAQPAQPPATARQRLNGTVKAASGGTVTLTDGHSFTLAPKAHVIRLVPIQATDLKVGDYVAVTATRQADNSLLATIVNIFPASMRGVGVGQRPMGGGDLMTNATINKLSPGGFTVTFPGGGARVKLAPHAAVNRFEEAGAAAIKPGVKVSALLKGGSAGLVLVSGTSG